LRCAGTRGTMGEMFRRPPHQLPITSEEFSDLIKMMMRIDWKLDLILEELEIDHGQASQD
jgi:hypothetical protein